jgi:hypothetical protein
MPCLQQDKTYRHRIIKEIEDLNSSTLNQLDPTDMKNTSYNKTRIYVVFKGAQVTLQDGLMLGHKTNLYRFKKIDTIYIISSEHK